jgi:hypothetical protein
MLKKPWRFGAGYPKLENNPPKKAWEAVDLQIIFFSYKKLVPTSNFRRCYLFDFFTSPFFTPASGKTHIATTMKTAVTIM